MSATSGSAPIAVLGAGSWGTALALQLARAGQLVQLWSYDAEQTKVMARRHENPDYLPGIPFPENLNVTHNMSAALSCVRDVLLVTPSFAFGQTLAAAKPYLSEGARVVCGSKGIDGSTGRLLSEVVASELGAGTPMAVLSGPSFAMEVARDLPTAVVIAGNDRQFCHDFAHAIHSDHFRPYTSDDLVGVQLCGAVKNPIAVAAGICDGLRLGANARCALITRGLAEITRLGLALGAHHETFAGLAGMGDLVLTCTDDQSRNRRFGLALGRGMSVELALEHVGQVVEGNKNAHLVKKLAGLHQVSMPIVEQVCLVVNGDISAVDAVNALLTRKIRQE